MQKKNKAIVIDLGIIAFELVPLNTRFYWERIHLAKCQFVNKQSQDLRYW